MDRITQNDWDRIDKLMRLAESEDPNEVKAADQGVFRILSARGVTTKDIVEALKKNTTPSKIPDTTYVRVNIRDIFGYSRPKPNTWEDLIGKQVWDRF